MNSSIVTTFSGKKVHKSKCRKIKGVYYEIDVDCFFVGDKWHRIDNGLIVKDYSRNVYVKKSSAKTFYNFGIVDEKDGVPVTGFYSKSNINSTYLHFERKGNSLHTHTGEVVVEEVNDLPRSAYTHNTKHNKTGKLTCISLEMAKKLGYEYAYSEDLMYPKTSKYSKKFKIDLGKGYGSLKYGSDGAIPRTTYIYNSYSSQIKVSKEHFRISKMIKNYSFGLEFETRNGYISYPILDKLGLIPVKDGSLRLPSGKVPYEFVTIPLKGAKGISTLDSISKVLTERTTFDQKCSMHLHIGNVPTDKMFICSMFKLMHTVQKELLTMFPEYKSFPEGKNYAKKLKKDFVPNTILNFKNLNKLELDEYISASFNRIYYFVSCGQYPNQAYNRKNRVHPIMGGKWNISSRYYLINFVPLLFKDFKTLEFRLHTPTSNKTKIFNWLLICSAFIEYATHYPDLVFTKNTITIEEILNKVYGKEKAKGIIEYCSLRKGLFSDQKDSFGEEERMEDKNFKLNTF
tara:strand:+ start:1434 stop:2978 length:1545 start_codon:yes stop_codon:yes gene_type:complete